MDDLRFYVLISTVFQLYQDDGRLIKAVCNGAPFTVEKTSPRARTRNRSVGQRLTNCATGAPIEVANELRFNLIYFYDNRHP